MSVEDKLIGMMEALREPAVAGETEWRRFASRAHRSLWGRRAAVVGAAGMTAFVGTSYIGGTAVDAPVIDAAGEQGDVGPREGRDHEAFIGDPWNPIVVIIKGDRGNPEHPLHPDTPVFGSADLNGGRLFFKVLDRNGEVVGKGKVETDACEPERRCREAYFTTTRFRVDAAQKGTLLMYIKEQGKLTASLRVPVDLKPE